MIAQRTLRQWHRVLGWIVGLQVTLWMISGLYMTAAPIDWIHGDHWVRDDDRVLDARDAIAPAALQARYPDASGLTLKMLAQRPVYELRRGSETLLIDAVSGEIRSPLDADVIRMLAQARFAGSASPVSVDWLDRAPPEVGSRPAPLWRVTFAGASSPTLYYSPHTGELLATRFAGWRVFDALWMLHIMDYTTRSDVTNPLLRIAACGALVFAASGAALLIVARRRRRPGLRAPPRPWPNRLHRLAAWIVGLQLLLWIGSGLTMSLLDPALVDGSRHARAPVPPPPLDLSGVQDPREFAARHAGVIRSIALRSTHDGPVYLLRTANGVERYDARSGLPRHVDAAAALALARADYAGAGQPETPQWMPQGDTETRGHAGALWRVPVADDIDTTLYVSAVTGDILERRNRVWRLFDIAWMLHIMDYRHRESFNHPLLILFACGGIWLAGSGMWVAWRRWRNGSTRATR